MVVHTVASEMSARTLTPRFRAKIARKFARQAFKELPAELLQNLKPDETNSLFTLAMNAGLRDHGLVAL